MLRVAKRGEGKGQDCWGGDKGGFQRLERRKEATWELEEEGSRQRPQPMQRPPGRNTGVSEELPAEQKRAERQQGPHDGGPYGSQLAFKGHGVLPGSPGPRGPEPYRDGVAP